MKVSKSKLTSEWLFRSHMLDSVGLAAAVLILSARSVWLLTQLFSGRADRLMDFASYYMAAAALRAGLDLYQTDPPRWFALAATLDVHTFVPPYIYPPALALALIPLTFVPFPTAVALWSAGSVLTFVSSACLFGRIVKQPAWPCLLAMVAFLPVNATLNYGQVNGMVLWLIVLALYGWCRRRYWLAAVGLAIGGWIKLAPVTLLVCALLRRELRLVIKTVVVALGLGLAVAVGLGAERGANFVRHGFPDILRLSLGVVPENPLWQDLLTPYAFAETGDSLLAVSWLAPVVWGVTIVRLARGDSHRAVDAGLVLTATSLAARFQWYHHLVWMLPAFWAVLAAARAGPIPRQVVLLAAASYFLIDLQWVVSWLVNIGHVHALAVLDRGQPISKPAVLILWLAMLRLRTRAATLPGAGSSIQSGPRPE